MRILVAEDEKSLALALKKILEESLEQIQKEN